MRSPVLALLLGATLACAVVGARLSAVADEPLNVWRPADYAPRFAAGHMYEYEWNSQLATSLSGQRQNALQRISARLRLSFNGENNAVAELTEIDMRHINDEMDADFTKLVPMNALKSDKIRADHMEKLSLPFEIRYEHGKIAELIFEKADNTWSENLKRAAVNSLQLQLDTDEAVQSYRTNETTIEGACESVYSIVPEAKCEYELTESDETDSLTKFEKNERRCVRVMRTIDFERCSKSGELRYNYMRTAEAAKKQSMTTAIERASNVQAELRELPELSGENGRYFVPVSTRTNAHYAMAASTGRRMNMRALVVSELRLRAVRAQRVAPELADAKRTPATLAHSADFDRRVEAFLESGERDATLFDAYMTQLHVPEVVLNVVRRLAKSFVADARIDGEENRWQLDAEGAHQFANLVRMLRFADEEDLTHIHRTVCEGADLQTTAEQKAFVRELMLDAFALAGTRPAAAHLLAKLENRAEVSEWKASALLQKLAKNVEFVGTELHDAVWTMCGSAPRGSQLQRSCVLAWSRMAHTRCVSTGDIWATNNKADANVHMSNNQRGCSVEVRSKITENLKKLIEAAGNDEEQLIMALKACGNTGLPTIVPLVRPIIENTELPRLVRTVAIDALRFVGRDQPILVHELLMPLVMERREWPEVRMNALHRLLKCRPTKPILDQIAIQMSREPNMNMRAYAISAFKNIGEELKNIDMKYSDNLNIAGKLIQSTLSFEERDRLRHASSRYESMLVGEPLGVFSTAALFSNDSHLPKEVMVQLDALVGEHVLPAFAQWGIHQQSLERLGAELAAKFEDKSLGEIFVRGKRSTLENLYATPAKYLRAVFEQLRIVGRRVAAEKPQLLVYRREGSMDVAYGYMDERHVPTWMREFALNGQFDTSALETRGERRLRWIDADMSADQRVKISTAFGVPLIYTMRAVQVANVGARVKLEFETEPQANRQVRGVQARLHATPKMSTAFVAKLEAFSPLFTAGVRTQHTLDAQLPLHIAAQYNPTKGLVIDMELPPNREHAYKLIQMGSHPSTIYRQWPAESRIFIEPEERTLIVPEFNGAYRQLDTEVRCPLTGMRAELRGHYHACPANSRADCWTVGENAAELHMHASAESARRLRIEVRATSAPLAESPLRAVAERASVSRIFAAGHEKALFTDATPNEVAALKEKMERLSTPQNAYKLEMKVHALNADAKPQRGVQVDMYAACDATQQMSNCLYEAKARPTADATNAWSARAAGQLAVAPLRNIYGSLQSQHVLAHTELEWGAEKKNKNELSVCLYGRPTTAALAGWKRMIGAHKSIVAENANESPLDEQERMLRAAPARLPARRFNVLVEHQRAPSSGAQLRRFLNYALVASAPMRSLWSSATTASSADAHQRLALELNATPNGRWTFRLDDLTHTRRMPTRFTDLLNEQTWKIEGEASNEYLNMNMNKNMNLNKDWSIDSAESSNLYENGPDARCFIDRNFNVRSFDGLKYKIPMSRCYTLLAKDCAHTAEQSKFAVLAKRLEKTSNEIEVKLVVPSKIFTLYEKNDKMIVEANGIVLMDSEFEKYGIHVVKESRRPIYVLHCETTGMEMRFDGVNVEIRLPTSFQNKQCGVCGHYNRDATDELRKQDNTMAESVKDFHTSYIYRDDKCSADEIEELQKRTEDEYHYDTEEEENKENKKIEKKEHKKYNFVEPILMTHVVELRNQICFSILPYLKCPRGTVPFAESNEVVSIVDNDEEEPSSKTKEFVCWSRKDERARKMRRLVERDGVVKELNKENVSLDLNVRIPTRCIRVHNDIVSKNNFF